MANKRTRRPATPPAAKLTKKQQLQIIEAAADLTGRPAAELTVKEALQILRDPEIKGRLPYSLQAILDKGTTA